METITKSNGVKIKDYKATFFKPQRKTKIQFFFLEKKNKTK